MLVWNFATIPEGIHVGTLGTNSERISAELLNFFFKSPLWNSWRKLWTKSVEIPAVIYEEIINRITNIISESNLERISGWISVEIAEKSWRNLRRNLRRTFWINSWGNPCYSSLRHFKENSWKKNLINSWRIFWKYSSAPFRRVSERTHGFQGVRLDELL